jgi:hypothetical protein
MDEPARILVIANETVADPALKEKILERTARRAATVLVVCPALNSRLRHWFSDDDGARARASERLDMSLTALWAEGVDADGLVGDSDPLCAVRDALAEFRPHEIVISTHPPGKSNWLEKDVVERARKLAGAVPVFHVVASGVETDAARSASA